MNRFETAVRVVIIDDDRDVVELHSSYLAAVSGCVEVGRARSIAEALPLLERERPDLLLLDVFLPDGTGIDLLRQLRRARPDAYDVMLVTAVSHRSQVARAERLGVVDYLVKPFTQADFTRRLGAYLERRRARSAAADDRPLTQSEVDAFLQPGAEQPLPKGLAAATSTAVQEVLRTGEALTATDVSERVGISRVSARRYLEYLVREQLVDSRPRYGGTGRPSTEYLWRGDGGISD